MKNDEKERCGRRIYVKKEESVKMIRSYNIKYINYCNNSIYDRVTVGLGWICIKAWERQCRRGLQFWIYTSELWGSLECLLITVNLFSGNIGSPTNDPFGLKTKNIYAQHTRKVVKHLYIFIDFVNLIASPCKLVRGIISLKYLKFRHVALPMLRKINKVKLSCH